MTVPCPTLAAGRGSVRATSAIPHDAIISGGPLPVAGLALKDIRQEALGYNNSDNYGQCRATTLCTPGQGGPSALCGLYHWIYHFAAAGRLSLVARWLQTQARSISRFPPTSASFPASRNRQQDLSVTEGLGQVKRPALLLRFRPPDQPFGQVVEGDRSRDCAGSRPPSHSSRCR